VTTGDIYAKVPENTLIEHRICVPIGARGNVTWVAPQGEYNINDEVLEIEFGGEKKARSSFWLVGAFRFPTRCC